MVGELLIQKDDNLRKSMGCFPESPTLELWPIEIGHASTFPGTPKAEGRTLLQL
jgi:hypothetical protein